MLLVSGIGRCVNAKYYPVPMKRKHYWFAITIGYYKATWCTVLSFLCTSAEHIDLPLTIEDLITEQGRFKLNASLTYQEENKILSLLKI